MRIISSRRGCPRLTCTRSIILFCASVTTPFSLIRPGPCCSLLLLSAALAASAAAASARGSSTASSSSSSSASAAGKEGEAEAAWIHDRCAALARAEHSLGGYTAAFLVMVLPSRTACSCDLVQRLPCMASSTCGSFVMIRVGLRDNRSDACTVSPKAHMSKSTVDTPLI
eukprot:3814354-Pyramimonas_sp.AAC.1